MRNVLEKLMVRSSDYVATIDVEDDYTLASMYDAAKAMVCVGRMGQDSFEGLKNTKVIKNIKQMDDNIFNKIVASYSDDLNLRSVVRVAGHMGLVLICDVPEQKKEIFESLLAKKAGIYEVWDLESDTNECVDFLFKVRKH